MPSLSLSLGLGVGARYPFHFLPIVNQVNTTVTNQGGGVYRIAKTGGTLDVYDASAVSAVGASGDFTLKIDKTATINQVGILGMNSDPLTADTWQSVDYGLLWSSGSWYVYESATNPATFADNGETAWIRRVGTTLSYLLGNVLETAVVQRTVNGATGTLYFDSSIQDTTVLIDVSLSAT